jgi:O-antigen/teichoic acid export membrane protein
MNIRLNFVVTYSARLYVALISVIIIPLIISAVGKDAYGLIGFFSVLQSSLMILDAGVGGSLTRETAKTYRNINAFRGFLKLFQKITLYFGIVSFCVLFIGWSVSPYLATNWIESSLPYETVLVSITCMFVVFSIRYMQGPFRSFIIGLECHHYLSSINVTLATLSAPGSLLLLYFTDNSIVAYFIYQASVAILILIVYICAFYKLKSKALLLLSKKKLNDNPNSDSSVTTFKKLIIFSLQLSTLSVLWVIATQSDKLTLTKFLSMSEYSFYSVAVSVAAMISVLSDPINQILQPRLTVLFENQDRNKFVLLFVKSFIVIALVGICLSFFFIYYSHSLLLLWSGDLELATNTGKYITWLIIGNVVVTMMNFVFILLYSYGQLKMHTFVYAVYCLFLIPSQIYIAANYLGVGSSKFYFVQSLLFFIIWGGYNLHKYLSGFISYFLIKFFLPCILMIFSFYHCTVDIQAYFINNKLYNFAYLVASGLLSVFIALGYCYFMKILSDTSISKIKLKV